MDETWITIADHLRDVADETPRDRIPEVIGEIEQRTETPQ